MSFRFAGIFALVIGLSNTTPVFADEASVKCVQEELSALGYDAGGADGKMGAKSRNAAVKYAAFMVEKTPGWAMEPLTSDSAELWCEKVAEAWPEVAQFHLALKPENAPAVDTVSFDLQLTGLKDVGFGFILQKGDAVTFQAEGKSGEPTITFDVPSSVVAASDRFCVSADPRVAHFEDQAGGKFSWSCEALSGWVLPEAVSNFIHLGYEVELHAGGM